MRCQLRKVFLLVFLIIHVRAGWKDTLKDIKEKAKNKFANKFHKGTKNFLGHDLSEYPGTNKFYRDINREKWNIYYDCLREQDKKLGHQAANPTAVAVIEGGFIKLECPICLSPQNLNNMDSINWLVAMGLTKHLDSIEFDEHTLVSGEDKSLLLFNLKISQSGQYMCTHGQTLTAPYFLTVYKSFESNIRKVHPLRAPQGPYPLVDQYDGLLRISTEWGKWSPCSQCNKVGKRHRYGNCMVFYNTKNDTKPNTENVIKNEDLKLLQIFQDGIPCSSHILPESIKNNNVVKKRQDEVMIGFCKEKCLEEKVFEVKDEYGNVIERANNSAGVYSMLQGLPPSEPQVEKLLVYSDFGSDVVLSCPGNLNSEVPLTWQIGHSIVIPELISQASEGRIYIGITDRIHIQKVQLSDSNMYSCWQHTELAGMVKLVVEKKLRLTFTHHLMMLGMIIIVSVFLLVFTRAFLGRKYAKIH